MKMQQLQLQQKFRDSKNGAAFRFSLVDEFGLSYTILGLAFCLRYQSRDFFRIAVRSFDSRHRSLFCRIPFLSLFLPQLAGRFLVCRK